MEHIWWGLLVDLVATYGAMTLVVADMIYEKILCTVLFKDHSCR